MQTEREKTHLAPGAARCDQVRPALVVWAISGRLMWFQFSGHRCSHPARAGVSIGNVCHGMQQTSVPHTFHLAFANGPIEKNESHGGSCAGSHAVLENEFNLQTFHVLHLSKCVGARVCVCVLARVRYKPHIHCCSRARTRSFRRIPFACV